MVELHQFRHVAFFDTTLRDGEQAPGYAMNIEQKVELAQELEKLGVNTIEVGFPASSPVDFEAAKQISASLKRAKPCGFARAKRSDIEACAEAMNGASKPQIEIATVGSDIHIQYKRDMSRQEVVEEAINAIRDAHIFGFKDVSLAIEDATRSDFEFLKRLIGESLNQEITSVAIPDTVGCCLPDEFGELIRKIRDFVGPHIVISVHCHNDLGLAVANSIAGIQAGAQEVQTTLCGIGERAGNTSLEELVAVLNSKSYKVGRVHDIVSYRLNSACRLLQNIIQLPLPPHKAVIGENVFSTEAGMHQQGVLKYRFTYEFLKAQDYGATPRIHIGRHSGRNVLRQMLIIGGVVDPDETVVESLYHMMCQERWEFDFQDVAHVLRRYEEIRQNHAIA